MCYKYSEMAREKNVWWKRLVVVLSLSALFVSLGLTTFTPTAYAADIGTYTFKDPDRIAVAGWGIPLNDYPDTENFDFGCKGTDPRTTANPGSLRCDAILNSSGNATCVPFINNLAKASNGDTFTGTVHWQSKNGNGCRESGSSPITIGARAADTSDDNTELQFECGGDGISLNWIMCPIYWAVNRMVGSLDNMINSMLTVNQTQIFDTASDSGAGFYKAWSTMRLFAIGLLLIAGLVMVIATAFGFEILDAYTIKKIAPRLIIAILAITLSWEIMRFFVVLTNNLGLGIRQIIYYPFIDMPGSLGLSGGATFVAGLLSMGGIIALTVAGLLSFALTAGLAILVAFIVLMVRQLVIVVLILLAPIAIACSILPNTQGAYKIWYESFTKALLMFPIIVAFIAVGRVFAVVSLQGDVGASTDTFVVGATVSALNQIIGFAAYFLPYFLLPMTFSLAGGAMRLIGGKINDVNRGGFDRLKKYRQGKVSQSMHELQAGERFNNRALNNLTARATTSRFGFGRRGREAWDNKMNLMAGAFGKSERAQGIQFKDPVLQAMTYASAKEAETRLATDFGMTDIEERRNAIKGAEAAGGFGKSRQVWATKQLAAVGTGYNDDAEMFATIARVSGGNKVVADSLWGEMRGSSERAGRNDLKASYGMGSRMLNDIIDNGNSRATTAEINQTYGDRFAEFGVDAARGVDNMQLARNKPAAIRNIMRRSEQHLENQQAIINQLGDRTDDDAMRARRNAEVTISQIRAKMQNMEGSLMYGPETVSEAAYGTRNQNAPVNSPNYRAPGISTFGEHVINAQQNNPGGNDAYNEELNMRGGYDPTRDPRNNRDEH